MKLETLLDWAPIPVYGIYRTIQREATGRKSLDENFLNYMYQSAVTVFGSLFAADGVVALIEYFTRKI